MNEIWKSLNFTYELPLAETGGSLALLMLIRDPGPRGETTFLLFTLVRDVNISACEKKLNCATPALFSSALYVLETCAQKKTDSAQVPQECV